jgi:Ni,Fe-hydrogenase III large subunit
MSEPIPGEPYKVFLPSVLNESPPASASPSRVAIDPITRIEGHLRIEVKIENGRVVDAWSSGTMFRGIELVLPGRDPRDAWVFTQRICGV